MKKKIYKNKKKKPNQNSNSLLLMLAHPFDIELKKGLNTVLFMGETLKFFVNKRKKQTIIEFLNLTDFIYYYKEYRRENNTESL